MKKTAPPIKVWIWVGISYLVIQILIIIWYYDSLTKEYSYLNNNLNSQLSNIKSEFENSEGESYKVIVIGSSLTGCGVKCKNELLYPPTKHKKINLQLTKIWYPGDPFKLLIENTTLIEKLVILKPDLICFQTEFLTTILHHKDSNPLKEDNFLLINMISHYNNKFVNDLRFIKNPIDSFQYGCKPIIYKNQNIDTLNHKPMLKTVKKIPDLKYAFNGLLPLKNANIKMMIVDVPRPQKKDINDFSKTYSNNLQELLKVYKKELAIDYWYYYGSQMYYKYFADGAHLNEEGSEIYTKWLTAQIETIIE
ncbi:MAG: hypothetical protein ACJA1B_002820 [Polaribacter sp.]|jgi:hypothetical protein